MLSASRFEFNIPVKPVAPCLVQVARRKSAALLLQLLEGSPARAGAALDPVGSGLNPGPDAYADLMRGLARSLADCLNGA